MKRILPILLWIMVASVLIACQDENVAEPITFSDEQLEIALREEAGKASDEELYETDFDEIVEINLSELGIGDLSGLEVLDSLETLSLEDNEITDFSILTELENLEKVNVVGNPIDENEETQTLLEELNEKGIEVINTKPEIVGSPDGPGGFLWEVENGDTTVYLQGTIHIGIEDLYPLHEKIEEAYASSDVIVPEIDLTTLNPFELQDVMVELGTYQDGTTIKDHIPEELYNNVGATLEEIGIPLQLLEMYKPWILSSTIQQLMTEQLGYIHGVDEYFLNRAADDGKEIIALETAEEQFNIFAETSLEYQVQMLEESLIDLEIYKQDLDTLIGLYKEGDIDKLLAALTAEEDVDMTEEDQEFMEALNDNRNDGMAEDIMGFLEEDNGKTYFVIVGSLHYIMEPHIISILEENGYEVEHIH
ncbi:TraB/GumN family protein [Oceanobacillus bengalensis]|uniref:TraB/GumN family protein n=1 Tax=Oceanobacillus bengalensis TaxID=1435466 RepID=A0A494YZG8_9BACI|nr:TraB/GumN family protein [Oceanobacillus bengalensis]RKQ15552.1 hypothetical protein D8M05_09790 [Oceanobacillus bengalensis]